MAIFSSTVLGRLGGAVAASVLLAGAAWGQPKHGIAMYGDPALPPDFVSLPYANPDAPKGGKVVFAEGGSFTSLNPYVRKGSVPWQLRFIASESLMGRSYGEPFGLYGLLAESIETPEDRSWVEFTLREGARFSDGSPVTVEDVMWSYETLGTVGHPRYLGFWKKIEKMEQTGPRSVRFTFNVEDRELALIAGLRPILKKAQWDGKDFADSGLEEIPITTAPYVITDFDPGKYVTLTRNKDYWGKDVPFRRGTNNFDEIRMDFYLDGSLQFEAFKGGASSSFRELNAEKWETQYDFPAVTRGDIVKSIVPHQRPSGIKGYVMNTRKPQFKDWRVRQAMIEAFNFKFINTANTGGRQDRITSYFSNSVLGMRPGPAEGKVAALLEPFADELLPGTIEGYTFPEGAESEVDRRALRRALALFEEAGWTVNDQGQMVDGNGKQFEISILLKVGDNESRLMMDIYAVTLRQMGLKVTIESRDPAQYKERTQVYDFDMAYYRRGLSLSPGNEQMLYWGADGIENPGTRNWMGMNSPAAEAMINRLVNSTDQSDFLASARALDRILTAGRYVIPIQNSNISRLAHIKEIKFADTVPMYGDWIGFLPDVWWYDASQ